MPDRPEATPQRRLQVGGQAPATPLRQHDLQPGRSRHAGIQTALHQCRAVRVCGREHVARHRELGEPAPEIKRAHRHRSIGRDRRIHQAAKETDQRHDHVTVRRLSARLLLHGMRVRRRRR
jgi:hypothetical protein